MTKTSALTISQLLQKAAAAHRAGDLTSAEEGYRSVLKKNARDPDALYLLGLIADQRQDPPGATILIQKALAVRDDFPDAHHALARILLRAGQPDPAITHLQRALLHRPTFAAAYRDLATALAQKERFAEATAAAQEAVKQEPGFAGGYIQLARFHRLSGDIRALKDTVEAGLRAAPDDPLLAVMASEAAFALGDLDKGWCFYRSRFQSTDNPVEKKNYALPEWQGEPLAGRTILLWGEQGIGDEVMYTNMLPDVLRSATRCVIQCSPRLAKLWRRSFPGAEVVGRDLTPDEVKAADVQLPMAGLGEWLRPTLSTFPVHDGYLKADPTHVAALRAKYKALDPDRLVIGIAWRSVSTDRFTDKTVGIGDWGPIFHLPGVTFVSLQYGDCAADLDVVARGFGVTVIQDPAIDPLGDLDAYAAQVAAMDVVISSSNTTAHFAGALNVPLLCMLPASLGHGRRWYWFAETGACPWYPSTRLFIKTSDWLTVIRDVALALLDIAQAKGAVSSPHRYLLSIAKAFTTAGRPEDAEQMYLRLAREPGHEAEGLYHCGYLKAAASDTKAALSYYDRAIAADPSYWHAYNDKGALLASVNRLDEGIASYREGLRQHPASAELHNNIGTALSRLGHAAEALRHYSEAMRLRPDLSSIRLGYASTLNESGQTQDAMLAYQELVGRHPDFVDARYNYAQLLLSCGQLSEGWEEFVWRLKRPSANVRHDSFPTPVWDGEDLAGKEILIWTEQGIGDEILVASMLPDALTTAKRVTFLCSERLLPLMRRSFPSATVAERKEPLPDVARKPSLAFQLSFSELGRAFRSQLSDFPQRGSFLVPDTGRRDVLRRRYQKLRPGKRLVGISWRSHFQYEIGWLKSQALVAWRPILDRPDIAFVNLQYGDQQTELAHARELGLDIIHDSEIDPLKDMDAFAAQVAAMDLVISVSNTTVHTAGSLGIPVWVLLAEGRGRIWYWFRDRPDSPWYPSARLLRQAKSGEWDSVIARCAAELSAWAAEPATRQQESG